MKIFMFSEYCHEELLKEFIVSSDSMDEAVEVYISTRKKKYYEQYSKELSFIINEEPNEYGIYQGFGCEEEEDEDGITDSYDKFDIYLNEINILPNELVEI